MADKIVETFVATLDPRWVPIVTELDRVVMDACPELKVRYSYRMLIYTLQNDFRHWICAVGVTGKVTTLRFLYGTLLDDPKGLLRAGSSHLKTLDLRPTDKVDTELVSSWVRQAAAQLEYIRAHDKEL
jgi:hypothetical protein